MLNMQPERIPLRSSRLPPSDLFTAFYHLSKYLSVGVSLTHALEDISTSSASRSGRRVWTYIGQLVTSGSGLSEALSNSGIRVDETVLAIIKSGEVNGQLGSACHSVSEYLRWHIELRQRIQTLLVYPLFSLCVLVVVTAFLFVSVVPAIKGFLLSTGEILEWHTMALLGLSAWVSQYFYHAIYCATGLVACLLLLLTFHSGMRYAVDKYTLKLPLLGSVLNDLLLSRYARCCAQLYNNGIALERSLQLAEATIKNSALRSDLADVRHRVVRGESFADALQPVSSLPSMFSRLVAVGEKSGQLSTVLVEFGEQQASSVEASISRMEQLIGPVLLLCVGSVLLWIVVSMLGPVYNMAIMTVVGAS